MSFDFDFVDDVATDLVTGIGRWRRRRQVQRVGVGLLLFLCVGVLSVGMFSARETQEIATAPDETTTELDETVDTSQPETLDVAEQPESGGDEQDQEVVTADGDPIAGEDPDRGERGDPSTTVRTNPAGGDSDTEDPEDPDDPSSLEDGEDAEQEAASETNVDEIEVTPINLPGAGDALADNFAVSSVQFGISGGPDYYVDVFVSIAHDDGCYVARFDAIDDAEPLRQTLTLFPETQQCTPSAGFTEYLVLGQFRKGEYELEINGIIYPFEVGGDAEIAPPEVTVDLVDYQRSDGYPSDVLALVSGTITSNCHSVAFVKDAPTEFRSSPTLNPGAVDCNDAETAFSVQAPLGEFTDGDYDITFDGTVWPLTVKSELTARIGTDIVSATPSIGAAVDPNQPVYPVTMEVKATVLSGCYNLQAISENDADSLWFEVIGSRSVDADCERLEVEKSINIDMGSREPGTYLARFNGDFYEFSVGSINNASITAVSFAPVETQNAGIFAVTATVTGELESSCSSITIPSIAGADATRSYTVTEITPPGPCEGDATSYSYEHFLGYGFTPGEQTVTYNGREETFTIEGELPVEVDATVTSVEIVDDDAVQVVLGGNTQWRSDVTATVIATTPGDCYRLEIRAQADDDDALAPRIVGVRTPGEPCSTVVTEQPPLRVDLSGDNGRPPGRVTATINGKRYPFVVGTISDASISQVTFDYAERVDRPGHYDVLAEILVGPQSGCSIFDIPDIFADYGERRFVVEELTPKGCPSNGDLVPAIRSISHDVRNDYYPGATDFVYNGKQYTLQIDGDLPLEVELVPESVRFVVGEGFLVGDTWLAEVVVEVSAYVPGDCFVPQWYSAESRLFATRDPALPCVPGESLLEFGFRIDDVEVGRQVFIINDQEHLFVAGTIASAEIADVAFVATEVEGQRGIYEVAAVVSGELRSSCGFVEIRSVFEHGYLIEEVVPPTACLPVRTPYEVVVALEGVFSAGDYFATFNGVDRPFTIEGPKVEIEARLDHTFDLFDTIRDATLVYRIATPGQCLTETGPLEFEVIETADCASDGADNVLAIRNLNTGPNLFTIDSVEYSVLVPTVDVNAIRLFTYGTGDDGKLQFGLEVDGVVNGCAPAELINVEGTDYSTLVSTEITAGGCDAASTPFENQLAPVASEEVGDSRSVVVNGEIYETERQYREPAVSDFTLQAAESNGGWDVTLAATMQATQPCSTIGLTAEQFEVSEDPVDGAAVPALDWYSFEASFDVPRDRTLCPDAGDVERSVKTFIGEPGAYTFTLNGVSQTIQLGDVERPYFEIGMYPQSPDGDRWSTTLRWPRPDTSRCLNPIGSFPYLEWETVEADRCEDLPVTQVETISGALQAGDYTIVVDGVESTISTPTISLNGLDIVLDGEPFVADDLGQEYVTQPVAVVANGVLDRGCGRVDLVPADDDTVAKYRTAWIAELGGECPTGTTEFTAQDAALMTEPYHAIAEVNFEEHEAFVGTSTEATVTATAFTAIPVGPVTEYEVEVVLTVAGSVPCSFLDLRTTPPDRPDAESADLVFGLAWYTIEESLTPADNAELCSTGPGSSKFTVVGQVPSAGEYVVTIDGDLYPFVVESPDVEALAINLGSIDQIDGEDQFTVTLDVLANTWGCPIEYFPRGAVDWENDTEVSFDIDVIDPAVGCSGANQIIVPVTFGPVPFGAAYTIEIEGAVFDLEVLPEFARVRNDADSVSATFTPTGFALDGTDMIVTLDLEAAVPASCYPLLSIGNPGIDLGVFDLHFERDGTECVLTDTTVRNTIEVRLPESITELTIAGKRVVSNLADCAPRPLIDTELVVADEGNGIYELNLTVTNLGLINGTWIDSGFGDRVTLGALTGNDVPNESDRIIVLLTRQNSANSFTARLQIDSSDGPAVISASLTGETGETVYDSESASCTTLWSFSGIETVALPLG